MSPLPGPTNESDDAVARIARLRKRVERERAARHEAERLLESKSLELFTANRALQELATSLEQRVEERTSEIRSIEAQLRQSQKMEAVGLLAGGIAHDFNNLLMIIGSGAELLRENAATEHEEILGELQCAVARGRELTSRLLAFSRKQPVEAEDLDTAAAIGSLAHLLRRLVTERVTLSLDLAPDLAVRMNRGSLEQILLNLVANARDAMPHGGTLRVRTSSYPISEDDAVRLALNAGPHVLLEVIDTGTGMASETAQRAFDPFFSTKPIGSGTGLGLSTVYSIVHQAGGHIAIESAEGAGATFRILLPCQRLGSLPCPAANEAGTSVPRMNGVALLVDDDDSVRRVTASLLRRHGLQVHEATGGDDALHMLADASISLDLLISDVRMPGMNGFDLAVEATAHRPDMPVLLMSGYVDDLLLQEHIDDSGITLLEKPVNTDTLLRHLRQILRRDARHPNGVAE